MYSQEQKGKKMENSNWQFHYAIINQENTVDCTGSACVRRKKEHIDERPCFFFKLKKIKIEVV